jgi:transposase, IS5 family
LQNWTRVARNGPKWSNSGETESQIIIDYEVSEPRPNDSDLLVPDIDTHQALLGTRTTFGGGGYRIIPPRTRLPQKQRASAFPIAPPRAPNVNANRKKALVRNGQKWRTGCEGRISVAKRRHGLRGCLYKGCVGMHRWVGFGVIADNLVNIGGAMENREDPGMSLS